MLPTWAREFFKDVAEILRWCVSPAERRRSRLERWGFRTALDDIRERGHEAVLWRFVGEHEKRVFAGIENPGGSYPFRDGYNLGCLAYLTSAGLRAELQGGMLPAVRAREAALFADPAYAPALARRHLDGIDAYRQGGHPGVRAYAGAFAAMGCPDPGGRLRTGIAVVLTIGLVSLAIAPPAMALTYGAGAVAEPFSLARFTVHIVRWLAIGAVLVTLLLALPFFRPAGITGRFWKILFTVLVSGVGVVAGCTGWKAEIVAALVRAGVPG